MAQLIWSKEAKDDLDELFILLFDHSQRYAQDWVDTLFKNVELLPTFPRMGRIVPETNVETIRELLVGKYRVLYALEGENRIEILAIRHSSRPLHEK